jgi:hypothetical protein
VVEGGTVVTVVAGTVDVAAGAVVVDVDDAGADVAVVADREPLLLHDAAMSTTIAATKVRT